MDIGYNRCHVNTRQCSESFHPSFMTCNNRCTLQPVNLVSSSASLNIKEEIYQNTRTLRRWTILKRTGTLDACLSTLLELIPSLKCCSCLLSISTKHLHQPAQQEPQGGTAAAIQPFAINEDQTQDRDEIYTRKSTPGIPLSHSI